MNDLNLDYISIGPRRYAVNLLNPMDGIEWGNRTLELFGPVFGQAISALELSAFDLKPDEADLNELGKKLQPVLSAALSGLGGLRAREVSELQKAALARCHTPENEPLENMAVFNAWFRRHPEDLHRLAWLALFRLVRDFFPSRLATFASAFLTRINNRQNQAQ